MRQDTELRLSCQGCRHVYVTHDPHRPWGCRNFGFKGKICLQKPFICLLACNVHIISESPISGPLRQKLRKKKVG